LKQNRCSLDIRKACCTLGVSRSGFYEYLKRRPSRRALENEVLKDEIRSIFEEHKGRYGSKRIAKVLSVREVIVNRKRVSRLMRAMNLFAKGTRLHYRNYRSKPMESDRPNLLNQVFQSSGRNRIWVGDITYIPTQRGFLYLAVFLDICTRKATGWSMNCRMKNQLVIDAFKQAIGRDRPDKGIVVHTDQGPQFTSGAFRTLLSQSGAILSNSRKGNPYDNAVMESFYRTLKRELIQGVKFESHEQAQMEIFKYIELYYNPKRIHSSLGYLSPIQYENQLSSYPPNPVSSNC
jgi:putative transposase